MMYPLSTPVSSPFLGLLAVVLLFSCKPKVAESDTFAISQGTSVLSRLEEEAKQFSVFELAEGECASGEKLTLNLGGGADIEMEITSALAINAIEITSLKGDQVGKRNGYTLYLANYEIDPSNTGENPSDDFAKIEMTMLSLDSSRVSTGLFGKPQDGNLVVGPNLFYQGKAYPMKNNFIGGVKITKVGDGKLCGEIRLKSKFDVKIIGKFEAPLIEPRF